VSVIFLLIPLSILLAIGFLIAFAWAVTSGQYEDTNTPSMRVLLDEPGVRAVGESAPPAVRPAVGGAAAGSNFRAAAAGCPSRNSNKP
jgi:cbb3-type cytochrome oxidase maturation protein